MPEVLDEIDDISIVRFDGRDVVRHKLVQRIVNAYKAHDDQLGAARAQRAAEREGDRDGHGRTRDPRPEETSS